MMMTQREKMLAGQAYNALDPELKALRAAARLACAKFNAHPSAGNMKHITRLFQSLGSAIVEPGFQCDYGLNIEVGQNFYANFQCVLLDSAPIIIGNDVLFGPGVHIYTVSHAHEYKQRALGICTARPVKIDDHVWVGGGAKVLPGVHIGEGCIIGANAVVSRDIKPFSTFLGS